MKSLLQALIIAILLSLFSPFIHNQEAYSYQRGLKVSLNEDGSKYFRLLTWHQMWVTSPLHKSAPHETSFTLRRSRVLMYAWVNEA